MDRLREDPAFPVVGMVFRLHSCTQQRYFCFATGCLLQTIKHTRNKIGAFTRNGAPKYEEIECDTTSSHYRLLLSGTQSRSCMLLFCQNCFQSCREGKNGISVGSEVHHKNAKLSAKRTENQQHGLLCNRGGGRGGDRSDLPVQRRGRPL